MGKFIDASYFNVKTRVIKKSLKRDKGNKKPTVPLKSNDRPKRRISSGKAAEPKTENQETNKEVLQLLNEIPRQCQIINPEISVVKGSNADDIILKLKESSKDDLFFSDEIHSSYENYIYKDFGLHIIDEISLEGLDGITIEAFWKRLLKGLDCPLTISYHIKALIWQLICANERLQFFQLTEPRGVLDIYNRFKYFDNDVGVVMEMAYELPDIYPHELVNHPDVQGSCSTFHTRIDISSEVRHLSLKAAEEKYGRTLVIVASQELRKKALFGDTADPTVELQNLEYCILERIGRSRKHGEVTQGNMSITSHIKMDPKSVFHYKKQLIQNDLLAKQFFFIKSYVTDQNKTGRLLHLKRFFHLIKPKPLLIAEQIINIIKTKPSYRLEYSELRKIFPDKMYSVSRVLKSQEFHKYVKTDCLYPYRTLYPNARKSEYMRKAKPVEKYIRCLELIDPYINLSANWCNTQEDSDEDDDDGEEEVLGGKMYGIECFKEVYYHILSKGKEGCSLQEIDKIVGIDNNSIRMSLKKLVGKNVVDVKRFDKGKQRHLIYYARCLEDRDTKSVINEDLPKPSNVLAKIKQRQREARKKQNLSVPYIEKPTQCNSPRTIDINLSCPYFVKIYNTVLNTFLEFYDKAEFISIPRSDVIKLSSKIFGYENKFEINQILCAIDSKPIYPPVKQNVDQIFDAKTSMNFITKLMLIKAALEEVVINGDTLNLSSRKRKRPTEIPKLGNVEKEKLQTHDKKLQYMGDSPVTVFNEKEGDICTEIMVSTPPAAFKDEITYPKCKTLSERVVSRIQLVLNIVYEKKIFEDVYKMLKVIEEEEIKEGYEKKIDRKSLARILNKLVQEGYVKVYKLVICDDKVTKSQTFICHPSVSHTNSIIQSAYQQLKWKYFVGTQKKMVKPYVPSVQKTLEEKIRKVGESPFRESDVMRSIAELREMNMTKYKEIKNKHNRYSGRAYGFKPKFIRMRILHEFLFYIIYCFDKDSKPLTKDKVSALFNKYRIDLTNEDLERMPKIYCKEISWKMFVPPLPHHKGWVNGWALMCDVILRLPISVLCKVHNVMYEIPDMIDILNHPIKRFYLVKDLPENIRNVALFKRKYLFDIHDTMCRLAYCGLVQFGPQKYKEKDQVFIYLNRQATLLDTTTSEPAYHKVALQEYRQLAFFFNAQADVDSYWYNVYGIVLGTKLNSKQPGQLVTLVDVSARPELVNALKSKTPEEAIRDDNGDLPGDKRGAAGLDSSLWSHITRNWCWANKKLKGNEETSSDMGLRQEKLDKILPQNLSYNELHMTHSVAKKVYLHSSSKEPLEKNKVKALKKCIPMPLKTTKTVQRITRKIPNRHKKAVKQYYDHVDKVILKRIGAKTKTKWSEREDKILLLCKAASILLNPRFPKKQMVPYNVVRDVLHRVYPESRNKTSRACQRRIKQYVTETYPRLEDDVVSLFKLEPISKYYSLLINNILKEKTTENKPFKLKESELSTAFVILMSYMVQHQKEVENILKGNAMIVDHLAEDNLEHTEKDLIELEESLIKYQMPETVGDIKKDILKTVIHSSLESKNQPDWAFQLFKIYQKYPDNIIRDAVAELKHSQTISFKRFMKKRDKVRLHSPFQLSNIYVYSQATTFSKTTAIEAYRTFLTIKENNRSLNFSQEAIELKKYGQLLGLNEFFSFWEKYKLKFYLPQNTVILNPHIKDHSELINELATRWQLKLKKMSQENVDAELEPDTETDSYRSKTSDSGIFSTFKEGPSTSHANLKTTENLDADEIHDSPLDLTVDAGNSETIDRLKTWVTDCMEMERERRSPSPEFMGTEECNDEENKSVGDVETPTEVSMSCKMETYLNDDPEAETMNPSTSKKALGKDEIPTLEEIKEGMLQYTSGNENRKIPYITDLSLLLTKENFTELNTDEKTLERLKNHFITQYALLEDIIIEDDLQDFYMTKYLQQTMRNKKMWSKIKGQMVIGDPSEMSEVFEQLTSEGASESEFYLVEEIVGFIHGKKELGATSPQIQEQFKHMEQNCSLAVILKVLVDKRILLKTGICTLTFVHYLFQSVWLIETFTLSQDEQKRLEEETGSTKKDVRENIDKHLDEKTLIRVKVMPWTKVDGTVNEEGLKMWLCNILSHCLDYPNISFIKLCEKFCYLKPADIYYLVEVLQELGCVDVFTYEANEPDLFSKWQSTKERYATMLDSFEEIYVTPNNIAMISMGSFFYDYEHVD